MNCNVISRVCDIIDADIYLSPFLAGRSIGKRARRIPGNLCSVLYQLLSLWLLSDALCKNGSGSSPGEERRYELKNFQKDWMASCDEAEKEMGISKSAYKAYMALGKMIQILLCATMIPASGVPYRYSRSHCRGRHLSDDDTHISSFLCQVCRKQN